MTNRVRRHLFLFKGESVDFDILFLGSSPQTRPFWCHQNETGSLYFDPLSQKYSFWLRMILRSPSLFGHMERIEVTRESRVGAGSRFGIQGNTIVPSLFAADLLCN